MFFKMYILQGEHNLCYYQRVLLSRNSNISSIHLSHYNKYLHENKAKINYSKIALKIQYASWKLLIKKEKRKLCLISKCLLFEDEGRSTIFISNSDEFGFQAGLFFTSENIRHVSLPVTKNMECFLPLLTYK